MVLIFQHNMLHEGERLNTGLKYIMRSDVMYQRQMDLEFQNQTNSNAGQSATLERGLELLAKAEELESTDANEAMKLYKQAYRMCPELDPINQK